MNRHHLPDEPARPWIRYRSPVSPPLLCFLVALASVILSCYPVVFFGKSFLSPNNHSGTYLLYGRMPTLPGYNDATTDEEKGADMGAVMWYSWPTSVVESRALLKYRELPLWNRYDSAGIPLLGQGQSMVGDPLHLLVILLRGSSAAWDLKYILAKLFFSFSVGLCVLQITRNLPAAVIITASAPFIGFFSYRYSHPAFFSLCYAPAILLCWLKLICTATGRSNALWLGGIVLANWMMINSGTVKEAYILLLTMNLSGLLALFFAREVIAGRIVKLRQILSAQLLFVVVSTPAWFTFLHTLHNSGTAYETKSVYQLQPGLIIGLFDDIFYRQFNSGEDHVDPSSNFLALAGVLWLLASRRQVDKNFLAPGVAIVCIGALATAFGVVPAQLIARTPFLGNILHIDNTFSCVAIVGLLILAGAGIGAYLQDCHSPEFYRTYLRFIVYFAVLLAIYFGTTQAAQRSTITFLHLGQQVPMSAFFMGYVPLLAFTLIVAPWLGRAALSGTQLRMSVVLTLLVSFVFLHWRNGMHVKNPFDAYVMNPHQRIPLVAKSPALTAINARMKEPARVAGFDSNFFPGYGGAVGLEQIDGPDPLVNRNYRSLMQAAGVPLTFGSWRYGITTDNLVRELPLFDMLNVRYYLSLPEARPKATPYLKKVASFDLDLYRSDRTWPRAYFTSRITSCRDDRELVELLRHEDGTPFAAISHYDLKNRDRLPPLSAVHPLQITESAGPSAPGKTVPATSYVLTANSTSFRVKAPGPGIVVLAETYVPDDFQVRLNNNRVKYFRVNSIFKGVYVERAGDYVVSFVYWPRFLITALWLSALGTIVLVSWLVIMAKSNENIALKSATRGA